MGKPQTDPTESGVKWGTTCAPHSELDATMVAELGHERRRSSQSSYSGASLRAFPTELGFPGGALLFEESTGPSSSIDPRSAAPRSNQSGPSATRSPRTPVEVESSFPQPRTRTTYQQASGLRLDVGAPGGGRSLRPRKTQHVCFARRTIFIPAEEVGS